MAETSVVEEPGSAMPGASPGDLDRKLLADIKLGEDVVETAGQEPYATKLVAEDVTPQKVTELQTSCAAARTLAGQIVAAKRAKKKATESEGKGLTALMQTLRDLQKRAKRKFGGDKIKLQSYRIGKNEFGDNRTDLEQDAVVIIDLAEADALPGLTPEKLAAARQQLAAWKSADEAQQAAEKTQADLLTQLRSQVSAINAARRDIQFAADALWPHTNADNAPTRKLFKLHPKRPMQ